MSLAGVRPSGFDPSWVAAQQFVISTKCSDRPGIKQDQLIFCNRVRPQDFVQINSLGLTPPCMSTLYRTGLQPTRPSCKSFFAHPVVASAQTLVPCRYIDLLRACLGLSWAFPVHSMLLRTRVFSTRVCEPRAVKRLSAAHSFKWMCSHCRESLLDIHTRLR